VALTSAGTMSSGEPAASRRCSRPGPPARRRRRRAAIAILTAIAIDLVRLIRCFFFMPIWWGMIRVPCDARMQKHTTQIEAMTSQI